MTTTTPGLNPKLVDGHFTSEEKKIILKLGMEWYITSGGSKIELGVASKYKYFLMKPTKNYQELFNIERELIVIFSDYENFEPRTLDAFDKAATLNQDLRIEKVCSILISKDPNIDRKIRDLLKSDAEHQVVVPFTYKELIESYDTYFLKNRFKEYFYSRDLFAFNSALKKDLYFFGRTDLIHTLINRHRSNENSGLFGLRKSGKTSIVFGVRRALSKNDGISVFMDCQMPSFHLKSWNKALRLIIEEIKFQNNIHVITKDESQYTLENASTSFEKDIIKISKKLKDKSILIIFDEIEHISPFISLSEHWKSGNDFILFWQTLRSLFQKHNELFSYLIVGTNPKCVETPFINGVDNPIFNQVPYEYIPQFDVSQTREMIKKIGGIMGMKFDEIVFSRLTDDFGGHPFLMRSVCSSINSLVPKDRPVKIDKSIYEKGKEIFNRDYNSYFDMILSVLKEYYNNEYEMLRFLALGDIETFDEFATSSKEYTNHLLGYNILDRNNYEYYFKIESIKQHLIDSNKYKKIHLSIKEKYSEISERRNEIEPKIRQIIRTTISAKYDQATAKQKILDVLGEPRKSKYYSSTLKDIFNPNKSEIFFEDLRKIIAKDWTTFENIFGRNLEEFNTYMNGINKYRVEAHAKNITDDEMSYFRVCINKIEKTINDYI